MPILPKGSPLEHYYAAATAKVGETQRHHLGVLDRLVVQRYALAIGSDDPRSLDPEAARVDGHDDVLAPPNLLSAMFEWGVGTREEDLNADGTPPRARVDNTLRGMGVGEQMEVKHPVVAGMDLYLDESIHSVEAKSTRSGPCVFLTTSHVFMTADGTVLNRNLRTVVLQNPLERPAE